MSPTFEVIRHGSEDYRAAVRLRDAMLRSPMGMATTVEEIEAESDLIHVAGFEGGRLCATCLLVPEGDAVRMKRVAVDPALQGAGIGTAMLRFCEDLARDRGSRELYAHARDTAVRFYENAGYATEGDYFDEIGIPHIVVRRSLTD